MTDTAGIATAAERTVSGRPFGWLARIGLAARAIVYLIMGWLAGVVAFGERAEVDQRGVLVEVASRTSGTALVLALAAGFACYALWRLTEVFVGVTGERDGPGPRAVSLVRAIAYSVLTVMALSVVGGSRQTQESQQEQQAQSLMAATGGRLLVGVAGLALIAAGGYMAYQGLTTAFLRYFPSLPERRRTWVAWLGRIGTTARGIVFGAAGVLLAVAAWQVDSDKAGGIDDALTTIVGWPFGSLLVLCLGVGLMLFGLYGLTEAAWRRVPDEDGS